MDDLDDFVSKIGSEFIQDGFKKVAHLAEKLDVPMLPISCEPDDVGWFTLESILSDDDNRSKSNPIRAIRLLQSKKPDVILYYGTYNSLKKVEESNMLNIMDMLRTGGADADVDAFFENLYSTCHERLTKTVGKIHAVSLFLCYQSGIFRCDLGDRFECDDKPTEGMKYVQDNSDYYGLDEEETEEERIEREQYEKELEERRVLVEQFGKELSTDRRLGFTRNDSQRCSVARLFFGDRLKGVDSYDVSRIATEAINIFEVVTLPALVKEMKEAGKTPKDIAYELGVSAAKAKKYFALVE